MAQTRSAQDLKDLRELRNLAQRSPGIGNYVIWGSVAVCAVFAAALTIALVVSSHRGGLSAIAAKPPAQTQLPSQRSQVQADYELARLNDAIRALAAERDRLVNRVEQIERSVGDITAAIPKQLPAAPPASTPVAVAPAQPAAPTPVAETPPPPPARPGAITAPQAQAKAAPAPAAQKPAAKQQPPTQTQAKAAAQPQAATASTDSVATRTEFAVDLGGEASIDGLRALWASIRGNHGAALEGMRPLVSVREGNKPGTVELRLVAGPLANAGAAARVCANLQATGVACQTTVFDGQRLALR
jgi:outer membrane biosynthesis protein TonB